MDVVYEVGSWVVTVLGVVVLVGGPLAKVTPTETDNKVIAVVQKALGVLSQWFTPKGGIGTSPGPVAVAEQPPGAPKGRGL